MKAIFLWAVVLFLSPSILFAQESLNFWRPLTSQELTLEKRQASPPVRSYHGLKLDFQGLQQALQQAPPEAESGAWLRAPSVTLPLPDGSLETFDVIASPVMAPGLAARYPAIRSFKVRGRHDRRLTGRLAVSPGGLYAALKTPAGEVYIDPMRRDETSTYLAYYTRDIALEEAMPEGFTCFTEGDDGTEEDLFPTSPALETRNEEGVALRTYRFALACTGEYGEFFGGTKEKVLSSMNIAVNRVNQVLENELAIRLILIEENDQLIFLDPATDPYEKPADAGALVQENTGILNSIVGVNAYDVGHVFTRFCTFGVGGIAIRPAACTNIKGAGVTCFNSSAIELVAARTTTHEVGHQFDASHSWNNCPGNEDQISVGNAFEPGSGSTIMSYAGACGALNNVLNNQEDYYNVGSLEDIINYTRAGDGAGCATVLPTSNQPPTVETDYPENFFIPIQTPFKLTAQASDSDGDSLTYCWEQYNLGPSSPLGDPQGNAPAFRSYRPTASSTRIFPRLDDIINNTSSVSEVLPDNSREFTFRCTVRDNHPDAGAVTWKEVSFEATSTAGPFRVMMPNTEEMRWKPGERREVRWDVANTNNTLVNCQHIDISLSVDGGHTFPYLLAEKAPNTGSIFVTVPDTISNRVRIKVEASDNIFFDISDKDFQIWPPTTKTFTVDVLPTSIPGHCLPQSLTYTILSGSILGFDAPVSLGLTGNLPEGAVYSFSKNPLNPLAADTSILTITIPGDIQGAFQTQLQIATPGLDTAYRPFYFSTISNDFSAFAPVAPVDGARNIQLSTTFEWTAVPNADSYDFELAGGPDFDQSLLDSQTGLADTNYRPNLLLPDNEIFFWRIRPNNQCGSGEFLPPRVFQTALNTCSPFENNTKVNISGTGLPTVESTILVNADGTINDLNLPLIDLAYQPVKSLRISLISPAGTEVVLFDQSCGNTFIFKVGFDDDAPSAILCPPDDGIVFQPKESLSAFVGESIRGTWTLRVKVVTPGFGATGSINSWKMEFCAAITPTDPVLVNNDTLFVPPAQGNTITATQLLAQDANNTPEELEYTILMPPVHGTLFLRDEPLIIGSTFRQSDINGLRLSYSHDGSDTEEDEFMFIVRAPGGGLIPSQIFTIGIDSGAVVGTEQPAFLRQVQLFPNPLHDHLSIRFGQPPTQALTLSVFNTQGQEMLRRRFDRPDTQVEIPFGALVSGVYFVRIQFGDSLLTRKVVKQ